jgi:release factor glutamine methyltransferase
VTIKGWIEQAKRRLAEVSETASLDAQVLLAHHLNRPRAWVLAHPEVVLRPDQIEPLERKIERLEKGEPLAYLLGKWQFYGLELEVGPSVLIPRPETELLIDEALHWLRLHPERRLAADIGTGSGCIAIALAANVDGLNVIATDISQEALEIARRNVERYALQGSIHLIQADLLPEKSGMLDLVCANLPYIPTGVLKSLPRLEAEPRLALDGGAVGLNLIRRLLDYLPGCLAAGGLVLLEIEAGQGAAALQYASRNFIGAQISILPDLAGHHRVLRIQTSS